MRACAQRLPWRTQYLRPMMAGSVSSQASVAVKRCAGFKLPGVAIQSPRDTSIWRSSTRPADSPACAASTVLPARRTSVTTACSPLGNSCTASPAFTRPCAMRPHSVRGWLPVPSPSRATYCTGISRSPSLRSCAGGRLSSNCSNDGPWYHAASSGCVTLSPRKAETGMMPATVMPACSAKSSKAWRTVVKACAGSATASSLLTAKTMLGTRSKCASSAWRRVCGSSGKGFADTSSLVMSTSTTAASLPAAAVTMLRVYCSCPGASAMMNLRCLVAK